jgi:hypothetical protein
MLFSSRPRRAHTKRSTRQPFRPRVETLEDRLAPATFTVLNTNDSGADSLRQAILAANAAPGADSIQFNIGGGGVQTIAPLSALPAITGAVTIDGASQPGYAGSPLIELNGAGAGSANGLLITAGNSTVRGLVINRFSGSGIALQTNGGNAIEGNYIGTDVTGSLKLSNALHGISVTNGASLNRIGTNGDDVADAAERNVISGNTVHGECHRQRCPGQRLIRRGHVYRGSAQPRRHQRRRTRGRRGAKPHLRQRRRRRLQWHRDR